MVRQRVMVCEPHILRIRSECTCGRKHGITLETVNPDDPLRGTTPVYYTPVYGPGCNLSSALQRYRLRGYDTEWCVREYRSRDTISGLSPYVALACSADQGKPILIASLVPIKIGASFNADVGTVVGRAWGQSTQDWAVRRAHITVSPPFPVIYPGVGAYEFQPGVE